MTRQVLRLIILGAFATAIPSLASAMGPMSATLKNQGARPAPSATEATGAAPRPHHHPRHHRYHSAHTHKI